MRLKLLILPIVIFLAKSVKSDPELTYLKFSDYENYLFRDNQTSAQVLITSTDAPSTILPRFVIAFPAGNSGIMLYFNSTTSTKSAIPVKFTVQLVEGSLKSVVGANSKVGISGQFTLNRDAKIDVIVMGSVRALRDYSEQGTLHNEMAPSHMKPTPTSIRFTRNFFADSVVMQLNLVSTSTQPIDDSKHEILLPGATYNFEVTFNIPSLTPLSVTNLLRSDSQKLASGDSAKAVKSLAYLAYKEKFLAGGWHFLTYFGRDTLISTRLLLPILSSDAVEASLGCVFERIDQTTGQVCHEETIGDYAAWQNQNGGHKELGSTPIYTYQMIDPNFELLPLLSAYFLDESIGKNRAQAFLSKKTSSKTYAQILDLHIQFVLKQAADFYKNPSLSNLVHIKDGESVGNWRDSTPGLGWGRIPYDINVALIPSSLLAIERLANGKIITPATLGKTASDYRKVWEDKAPAFFTTKINDAKGSAKEYLSKIKLPDTLLSSNDKFPSEIQALSLRDDGSQVAVMNSDFSFNLMYHDALTSDFMKYVVSALQPFPRGLLLKEVGLLIANPAYDTNRTNWDVFSNTAYHGTCVWAFQQSMVALGIERQLKFCDSTSAPDWCKDKSLVNSLKQAHCSLWEAIDANPNSDFAETWSWIYDGNSKKFVIKNPSELSSTAMEPDAVQLWSFSLLSANRPDKCSGSNSVYQVYSQLILLIVSLFMVFCFN